MSTHHSRRRFLGLGLGSAATWAMLRPLQASAANPPALPTLQSLRGGLVMVSGAGGNIVAGRDAKGLVLIDGGTAQDGPQALRSLQRTLGTSTVHTLLNTHWHHDHTGLNEPLGRAGCRIIAHENTRLWLSTDVRPTPDAPPIRRLPVKARPNDTTYTGGALALGDDTLRYGYLPQAHTDGDLYVKFERANVLVTGGVVHGAGWPTADWVTGGWITGTANGYKALIALCDDDTQIVTAHAATPWTKAQLVAEQAVIANLADQLTRMLRKGFGPADVLAAAPAKDHEARLGDATEFLTESVKSLWPRMAPDA